MSDLITSARALLLPVESIKLVQSQKPAFGADLVKARIAASDAADEAGMQNYGEWHKWQFQLNLK